MEDTKNILSFPSDTFKEGDFERSKLTFDLLFVSVGKTYCTETKESTFCLKQVILIPCIVMWGKNTKLKLVRIVYKILN